MIAVDLILFTLLFVSIMFLFLVFQVASLRLFKNINLLYLYASAVLLSIFLVSLASYFLISVWFSSFNTYVLSIAGSWLAAIFASGFYTFLGPATADRSLTTHLFVLLFNEYRDGCTRDEIMNCLNIDGFIEKRIGECRKEQFISEREGAITLTEKGKRTARFYLSMLRVFGLRDREGYVEYFRKL